MKKYITISFVIISVYALATEYYGSCGRCGWALSKNGSCSNAQCNGYGPERDR